MLLFELSFVIFLIFSKKIRVMYYGNLKLIFIDFMSFYNVEIESMVFINYCSLIGIENKRRGRKIVGKFLMLGFLFMF